MLNKKIELLIHQYRCIIAWLECNYPGIYVSTIQDNISLDWRGHELYYNNYKLTDLLDSKRVTVNDLINCAPLCACLIRKLKEKEPLLEAKIDSAVQMLTIT